MGYLLDDAMGKKTSFVGGVRGISEKTKHIIIEVYSVVPLNKNHEKLELMVRLKVEENKIQYPMVYIVSDSKWKKEKAQGYFMA